MSLKDSFWQGFHRTVEKVGASSLRNASGIKSGRFHKLIHGQTDNPQLDAVSAIVEQFDTKTFLDFARSIRPDMPLGIINLDGKHEVHVYDIRELNKAFNHEGFDKLSDPKSFNHSMLEVEPVFSVQVPTDLFPSDFGVRLYGHGMEPTMPEGCAVGLKYIKSFADLVAGEVYLCNLPYEGLVLRQVVVAQGHNGIEFQQLHPDKTGYRSQIYKPDQAREMIIARKTWVSIRG